MEKAAGKEKQREKKNADSDIQKENSILKKEIAELKNANEIQDQFGTFVAELVNEFSIVLVHVLFSTSLPPCKIK